MPVNRWDDAGAAAAPGLLGQRVYTSRLLGADPDLVLHGGGNTSVKLRHTTVFGEVVDALVVKGSGSDLADVDDSGFAWLRLDAVARLAELDALADTEMAEQLALAALVAGGPAPSVEAILHALLPARFVDHTHADAVVTVTNTPAPDDILTEVYGDRVVVVPYVMPGFKLARRCAEILAAGALTDGVQGMVLVNHGIFTWGDTAKESYDRMIELVAEAERHLAGRRAPSPPPAVPRPAHADRLARAQLRAAVSGAAGRPMIVTSADDEDLLRSLGRPDLDEITQRGTATPDHVIRTKPWPLVGRDVDGFVRRYEEYFDAHRGERELRRLDPAPRVVLDAKLGMLTAGPTAKDAGIAADIYRHTLTVILDAETLGGYRPAPIDELFEVEYWDLEQAKLRRGAAPKPFAGQVALVTGAAGGIGRACAAALLAEGAAVVGVDIDPEIKAVFSGPSWLGVEADVTEDVNGLLDAAVERFGGLDIAVLNAGIFPASATIAALTGDTWRRVMAVNLDANLALLRAAHPLLALAPGPDRGRVVIIGSKNVPAPGPGAGAYSASKAAVTQLARVAALEWGGDGIRVNVIHPNAVFDTGIWTADVLAERASQYGTTVEEYRTANVLGAEVRSEDVARMCVAMCGPAFARTTGAQVPVDGGNERVI